MASPQHGGSGLLRGTRTRSYGSLVQSPYSPARIRKVQHLVQPGDTLQGLALKYGVTMEQIKRTNQLYTNDSIFLKKYLSIPVLAEQPDLSNRDHFKEDSAVAAEASERSVQSQPEHQEKSRPHRSASQANHKEEMTASDFMTRLDTRIRVSKRAAVKKMREVEAVVAEEDSPTKVTAGYQSPCTARSREGSPQTQQRSILGPVPLTVTTRASSLRDHEDEIFKL